MRNVRITVEPASGPLYLTIMVIAAVLRGQREHAMRWMQCLQEREHAGVRRIPGKKVRPRDHSGFTQAESGSPVQGARVGGDYREV